MSLACSFGHLAPTPSLPRSLDLLGFTLAKGFSLPPGCCCFSCVSVVLASPVTQPNPWALRMFMPPSPFPFVSLYVTYSWSLYIRGCFSSLFHSLNKHLPVSSVTLLSVKSHRQHNYNRNRNCLDSVENYHIPPVFLEANNYWEPSICGTQFKTVVIPVLLPSMGERQKSLTNKMITDCILKKIQ